MASKRGTPGRLRQEDLSATERESEIIEVARDTAPRVPPAFVAGRLFFRFDPGFQAALATARLQCFGAPAPLATGDLSEERLFDIRGDLRNHKGVLAAAGNLATIWGLDAEAVGLTLAFDTPINYPAGRLERRTDPDSGRPYVELRIYSQYAWAPVRRAVERMPWLAPVRDFLPFPGSGQPPNQARLRGMGSWTAARAMAFHFLRQSRPGERPTGGQRTWEDAARLWDGAVPEDHLSLQFDDQLWRRRERQLLKLVYDQMLSASGQLNAIKNGRSIPMGAWLALLGIDRQTWDDIKIQRPVPQAAWDSIAIALPETAADLLTMAVHEELIRGDR